MNLQTDIEAANRCRVTGELMSSLHPAARVEAAALESVAAADNAMLIANANDISPGLDRRVDVENDTLAAIDLRKEMLARLRLPSHEIKHAMWRAADTAAAYARKAAACASIAASSENHAAAVDEFCLAQECADAAGQAANDADRLICEHLEECGATSEPLEFIDDIECIDTTDPDAAAAIPSAFTAYAAGLASRAAHFAAEATGAIARKLERDTPSTADA